MRQLFLVCGNDAHHTVNLPSTDMERLARTVDTYFHGVSFTAKYGDITQVFHSGQFGKSRVERLTYLIEKQNTDILFQCEGTMMVPLVLV